MFFTLFLKSLCIRVLCWLAEKQTCPLVSPLSQNKEPESAIKSPFNNSLLPVKKYGTNYQWYYVLMVTAVVEIWTAQLGAIRVRKKTDSFISSSFIIFFSCMNVGERSQSFTNQILSSTSICSEWKWVDLCPHSATGHQRQAIKTCS